MKSQGSASAAAATCFKTRADTETQKKQLLIILHYLE